MSEILELIMKNELKSYDTLRLVASENIPDVEERLPFMLDLFSRYSFNNTETWKYPSYYLDEIENNVESMLKDYLDCKFVSVKPISGLNGMLSTIAAFNELGDLVLSLDPKDGGHLETSGIIKKIGLESEYLPFDKKKWKIDVEKLKSFKDLERVQMVYIDLCMVAFPQPIRELKEVLPKKTILVYDASHVFGLILGNQFQQPLLEGADIMLANTHKTFPGPHKAVFATNRKLLKWQFEQSSGHFVSHHHMADVSCLGLVLEKGKEYFEMYASETVRNAGKLAEIMNKNGIHVQLEHLNYTACHQLWIECGDKSSVDEVIDLLSGIDIIVNGALIPSLNGGWGIRIGVQEITKHQITDEGIEIVGDILTSAIIERKISDELKIKKDHLMKFCFGKMIDKNKVQNIIRILTER
ncbi:hypothetical protein [Paenibacillus sp. IHBB 10380]|uniref:hypothetical protein n=1 Tax=Paenibacillus sp. IHBB 10380 TaxID=1566358 RepID=UPI0005CFC9E2|nr:hypothetical protein [Paenibacillus sp. IHBB 10380]AJS57204.1 hypothetical protein UB51_00325 [Paenibacillus sp. IHBB 10380]